LGYHPSAEVAGAHLIYFWTVELHYHPPWICASPFSE